MSDKFAKLFETPVGQILVMLCSGDDDKPEIRFFAKPEGLGVCFVAITFDDSDKGWDAAGRVFEAIDQDGAVRGTVPLFDMAKELAPGGNHD